MKIFNHVTAVVTVATLCAPLFATAHRNFDVENDNSGHVVYCADTNDTSSYYNKWALSKIGAFEAWDKTTGSYDVKVGIIDSGIDASHEDLVGRIDSALSEDFTGGNSPLTDSSSNANGHGTAVAGIIGAIGNNGKGTAGVCHGGVSLISYKVNTVAQVVSAIYAAKNAGVKLLNISSEMTYTNDLKAAIENFPGIIVCAAGNRGTNISSESLYLNNLKNDNIIVVGATEGSNDVIYSNSNYSLFDVDLFAPGVSIFTTTKGGKYNYVTGTSFAAPFVTGSAALLLSNIPKMTAVELKTTIMQNVSYVDSLNNKCVTGGLLNVNQAINHIKHEGTYTYFQYLDGTKSKIYHRTKCRACNTWFEELHDWEKYTANLDRCVKCGKESGFSGLPGGDYNRIGGGMQSVDEEELCEHCEEQNIVPDTAFLDGLKDSLVA